MKDEVIIKWRYNAFVVFGFEGIPTEEKLRVLLEDKMLTIMVDMDKKLKDQIIAKFRKDKQEGFI